ncbi:tripartite tricarboxylate transporter TctB family protein [Allorhizobium terrae]|uniref:Tripartite tricarboxylate transporter TctB family protein n=1 Tax=Allorhizobium terrae TaxID=1848972 RepID=A0A4S4A1F6_9HYPH|nr:tripartite tricarboxylate transporter TctB family protein [Allorhizobium terrae]THF52035.1 tripartite tricarboxylate transporter TctB family protein [Allorhizobium terrae]
MSDTHSPSSRAIKLIGRASGLCLLALAVAYGIGGSVIEYSFSSDPLGPRVFPIALGVILGLLALLHLKSPGGAEGFPEGKLLVRVLAIPVLMVITALLFEPAGFAVSIFILTFGTALIFGASLKMSLIGGVGHAALWWVIFSYLLEVYLPAGMWLG